MIPQSIDLTDGKKVYFASDFHLGVPSLADSRQREQKIVSWLASIEKNAAAIFLVGDIFDFWFEYRHAIPKGHIRLQGKLAELSDKGLPIYIFTGNHDMWMFDYFEKELNIPIIRKPISMTIQGKKFLIGHGDGLGPGDNFYKFLKKIFANRFFQKLFSIVHPSIGIGIANYWSRSSRISNIKKDDEFKGEKEWLFLYCKEQELKEHKDYYIFGHRHLPLNMEINSNSRYINLGEWVNYYTYASFDGENLKLEKFE
jgi:UDP-2,3-diacylglucosamine hydrolase